MEVVPLHKHSEYTDKCVQILNAFWPRSKSAREHSLSQSCDQLPVSLAFVRKPCEVIGYSRIAAVQGIDNACLIESVIVVEPLRGKGFGRILMNLTEEFAKKRLGVQTAYLNTLDQKGFYSKLGYVPCKPVISLGANANKVPKEMLDKLLGVSNNHNGDCDHLKVDDGPPVPVPAENAPYKTAVPSSCPPPPPPPPPTKNLPCDNRAINRLNPDVVTWMKKSL